MRNGVIIVTFGIMILCFSGRSFSQDTAPLFNDLDLDLDFTIEAIEKKPYSITADVETKQTLWCVDRTALLFRQKYLDMQLEDMAWQTDVDVTIEGLYQKDKRQLYGRLKSVFDYNNDEKWESKITVEEAYISFQPTVSLAIDAGKKVHKWGKGYAFSPTAFFSRPKDLDDPDETLEGYYSLSADYIKSMEGLIRTFAVTPVFMPINRNLNTDLGPEDEIAWGGKFYFFTHDTDVDIMFLISDNLDNRIGMDFSKNLTPSFEIHGDAAWVQDGHQPIIDAYGNTRESENPAFNCLVGLRYLSSRETTYILEYYRNGQGYTAQEYRDYLSLIEKGYNEYLITADKTSIAKSKTYAADYNQQTAMKDYLYVKISQKDAFNTLYLIPSITGVYNMDDQSAVITPRITYTGWTNFILDLKTRFLIGENKTEYGEKINTAKIVLSLTWYF
jgi:hypothetical protein